MPSLADVIVGLASFLARRAEKSEALIEWLHIVESNIATHAATRERAARLRTELVSQLTPQQIEAAEVQTQATTLEGLALAILVTD